MGQPAIEDRVVDIVTGLARDLRANGLSQEVNLDVPLDAGLGLGSLERVELLVRIEEELGIRLPDTLIAEARTPRDLVHAIQRRGGSGWAAGATATAAALPIRVRAPESALTLNDVLSYHALRNPHRQHVCLEENGQVITYGELQEGAAALASGLLAEGLNIGESVGIMLPTGRDFFYSFLGTLFAGGVPVPIYPPYRTQEFEEYAVRQAGILHNAEARVLITFKQAETIARLIRPLLPRLTVVTTVGRLSESGMAPSVRASPDNPALIQYTSGSTGDPKGVVLSHANLLANIRAIGTAIGVTSTDVGVSWLPLYHDMGLIGSWLFSLYHAIPITMLSPLSFLVRPARWLWAIHRSRGTLSAAPNFAYELCTGKIREREIEGLDLSSWRLAFNGSEPVSPETIERFSNRFCRYGFRRGAMLPVYGLAECSVALTIPPAGRPPRIDSISRPAFERTGRAVPHGADEEPPLRFVACGRPIPGHEIRLVDDSDRPVEDRVEGHIQFRGPSATRGYHRRAEVTEAMLHNGWLDSGDLGYLAAGELFVTGRTKDIILKAGRNIYPHEIEEAAGQVPGIRKGCVVAFGIHDQSIGSERLVVLAETAETDSRRRGMLLSSIQERVTSVLGIPADVVRLVGPRVLPKTSSGKIQRSLVRNLYLKDAIGKRKKERTWKLARLVKATLGLRLKGMKRQGLRLLSTICLAPFLGVTLPLLWLFIALCRDSSIISGLLRSWSRLALRVACCPLDVKGLDNLEGQARVVMVANHASYVDAVVLMAALPPGFLFVAKQELASAPLVGTVIRKLGHVTVDRVDAQKGVADADYAVRTLQERASVLFFPEGTFSGSPGLRPFRLGAFKAAVDTGKPVIPISLHGTRRVLRAGSWILTPGRIAVVIGEPVRPEGKGWEEMVRLRDQMRVAIQRHCGEPMT